MTDHYLQRIASRQSYVYFQQQLRQLSGQLQQLQQEFLETPGLGTMPAGPQQRDWDHLYQIIKALQQSVEEACNTL